MKLSNLDQICARKEALVAQCELQRATLAEAWAGIERPIQGATTAANKVINTVRSPYFLAGAGLLAFKLSKSNFLRIPMMLWRGAKLVRRVHSILR
jgi:hypothetical protein